LNNSFHHLSYHILSYEHVTLGDKYKKQPKPKEQPINKSNIELVFSNIKVENCVILLGRICGKWSKPLQRLIHFSSDLSDGELKKIPI